MRLRRTFIIAVSLLISTSSAFAQTHTSTNYTLTNPRIVLSGGKAASTNYSLTNVEVGSLTSGKAESPNYTLEAYPLNRRYDDSTPPLTPIVIDEGDQTASLTQLYASWSSEDPETGISEYQYSIGTTQGGTDIVNWISTGANTEVTHIGLTLIHNQTYYFNVKAKNNVGLWSDIGYSDGITAIDPEALSITITSPPDNASFSASPVTVEGTVSDNSAAVTVNNISVVVTDNTFSASVVITASITPIIARAQSGAEAASDRINVYLDTAPPAITVLTPDENAVTRSSVIYGRVSEDTSLVSVNSTPAELIDTYFIAEPVLAEGENTITIEARDELGNTAQITHTFTYTPNNDKVVIATPLHNSTIDTSPITVTGTVTPDITYLSVDSFSLSTAFIEENSFVADGVRLQPVKSVVTATGRDELDVKHQDTIILYTPEVQHYELTKISGDIQEGEENLSPAGSDWELKLKVYSNNQPAVSETVEFTVTEGTGSLSSQYSLSDAEGELTITLTTDTDAAITNKVEAKISNCPEVKTTFFVDTTQGPPASLIKITDESITPVPGAAIPLIVKLTDQHNNPIAEETINFQITQGTGTLSSPTAATTYYGEAQVNLTCPPTPETLTQVTASSAIEPSVSVNFNITTSALLVVTIDNIIAKVNANDEKIQDAKADITVISDANFLSPETQLKIWQKGNKQKVEELSPEPGIYIRPDLGTGETVQIDKQIISYDPTTQIYVIKYKRADQIEERPYILTYIDYSRGIIFKEESYSKTGNLGILVITEMSDLVQIPEADNAWLYNTKTEKMYEGSSLQYTTAYSIYNRQVNTGIPDSEF
ncbi:MAG: hypothetical protein KAJ66_04745 [Candidatus Omnitrophica bacterium]|nr:hypothetical protein [Candidatus Omnitrophota bacterium]